MWTLKLDYASCPQCFVCCVNMIVIPVFLSCYSVSYKKIFFKLNIKRNIKKRKEKNPCLCLSLSYFLAIAPLGMFVFLCASSPFCVVFILFGCFCVLSEKMCKAILPIS